MYKIRIRSFKYPKFPMHVTELSVELPSGELTWIGCDDYEFIGGAGEGFAYFRWDTFMNTKLFGWQQAITQGPMPDTPDATRIRRKRNA